MLSGEGKKGCINCRHGDNSQPLPVSSDTRDTVAEKFFITRCIIKSDLSI